MFLKARKKYAFQKESKKKEATEESDKVSQLGEFNTGQLYCTDLKSLSRFILNKDVKTRYNFSL